MDIVTERKAHKVSQAEIATKLGVHQSTIARWETGALIPRPRDLMAVKVAIEEIVAERPTDPRPAKAA